MFGKVGSGITTLYELNKSALIKQYWDALAALTPVPLSTTSGRDSMLGGGAVAVFVGLS
jgi:hypothetical protein